MTRHVSKRAVVNGVNLHYVVAGEGPVVLAMHGWPQNHREFLPLIDKFAGEYRFIAPDLRGFADSDKPYSGYEPKTIAQDMLEHEAYHPRGRLPVACRGALRGDGS